MLHQFDLGMLVGDDLLGEAAHLRIFAVKDLCLGHIDCRLVVRQHQPDEVGIAAAGRTFSRHCVMHPIHAGLQVEPRFTLAGRLRCGVEARNVLRG